MPSSPVVGGYLLHLPPPSVVSTATPSLLLTVTIPYHEHLYLIPFSLQYHLVACPPRLFFTSCHLRQRMIGAAYRESSSSAIVFLVGRCGSPAIWTFASGPTLLGYGQNGLCHPISILSFVHLLLSLLDIFSCQFLLLGPPCRSSRVGSPLWLLQDSSP